jgi:hypothetical protein
MTKEYYESELEQLRIENARLKAENQSYFEITEMADNDYAMMQAVDFAEWATTHYVTFNNKLWAKRFSGLSKIEYITTQQLYDVFLKSQCKKTA